MKKLFTCVIFMLGGLFLIGMPSNANAELLGTKNTSPSFQVNSDNLLDLTKSFSTTMKKNAAYMSQYALSEKQLTNTYPLATGVEFASKVKSGGPWDYKRTYRGKYKYNGLNLTGEDLGNMHYGFVGRGAFFSRTLLSSVAGAYQIYSGTSHAKYYASYFDDPNDQKWINYGMNLWDNASLPSLMHSDEFINYSLLDLLTAEEKIEIREKVLRDSKNIAEQQNQELK
ncbi:polymorphic toxin type 44 domain-containing protein [Sporosarcina sp. HYO08]|uniref:polymorphic toxin type 44 domain-containing protein n=1 Tax=Sporosarcina sp. HYO08 TaxID=1759557 RepID=UPI0007989E4A|nr:polymorphic toxin type 44 domain-containing protein [Sporosarcina sp. HYO08]KXH83752.1 hypothetical protein AU377_03010 [Sporosarcina sp. HYO08]